MKFEEGVFKTTVFRYMWYDYYEKQPKAAGYFKDMLFVLMWIILSTINLLCV